MEGEQGIRLAIPLSTLSAAPGVAAALAKLMLALGGSTTATVSASEAPSAAPQAEPRRRGPARTPAVTTRKAQTRGGTPEQRYNEFISGLKESSKAFLALLESRGSLTIPLAMKELKVGQPKVLGGITGSINRWAKTRDVIPPYRADINKAGARVWIWTGGQAAGSAVPSEAPAKIRRPRKVTSVRTSPAAKSNESAQPASAGRPARKSASRGRSFNVQTSEALVETMKGMSRQFLEILKSRGVITKTEAIQQLNLGGGKALGGVVGVIQKVAGRSGVALPYVETRTKDGEPTWRWIATAAPAADASAAAPEGTAPTTPSEGAGVVRIRRRET